MPSIGSAIAIASGKGGVGKSTVALNLALALGEDARVGILDADVYGPNIVVGPQDVAHLDAKRVVELFVHTSVRVLGGVENMSGFSCPHCGEAVEIFTPVREDRSLWTLGVRKLGALPLDPALGADGGRPLLVAAPESDQAGRFRDLARVVRAELASAP